MGYGYQDYVERVKDGQEVELSSSRLLPTVAIVSLGLFIYIVIRAFYSVTFGTYSFRIADVIVVVLGILLMYILNAKFFVIKATRKRIFAASSFKKYEINPNEVIEIKSYNQPPYTFFGLFRFITIEFKYKNETKKILTWRKSNAFDERYKIRKIFEELKTK